MVTSICKRRNLPLIFFGLPTIFILYGVTYIYPSLTRPLDNERNSTHSAQFRNTQEKAVGGFRGEKDESLTLQRLGVLSSRNSDGWSSMECNRSRKLRPVSIPTSVGNLSFYVYDSSREDSTVTQRALRGWYFEREEIAEFLRVSRDLPLIDVGANVGLVTLQAAMQGRQVVAIEPVAENALRLCRSVLDFGHAPLVHVIQNAVSSREEHVTLAMVKEKARTQYEVRLPSKTWGYGATVAYSIWLDRLVDILPFKMAALKIDVESHEAHVLAGAERLFRELNIPLVWMEWDHVKAKPRYGGAFIVRFMRRHHMDPFSLRTGQPLSGTHYMSWPFTVLWRKTKQ